MEKKTHRSRTSRYHNFRDADGKHLTMKQISEMVGLSENTVRARLKEYNTPPTDIEVFLVKEAKKKADRRKVKTRLDALDIETKKEQLRALRFKNEKDEARYVLFSPVQLALDQTLNELRTELLALPEQVVPSIMDCRDEHEGSEILLESLRDHSRQFAKKNILIDEDVEKASHDSDPESVDKLGIKTLRDELDIRIKSEKLRELQFKNDLAAGKYVLLSDVQLAVDNFLIAVRTNLEALPEQVVQSIMVCRDEKEAIDIYLEALRHVTRGFAENPIEIKPAVPES